MNSLKSHAQDLETYRWKNRIILLKDVKIDSERLLAQLELLQANAKDLVERDVLLFLITNNAVYEKDISKNKLQADAIIKNYKLSSFKGIVLIGKDGGIKLKKDYVVKPTEIIELIDGMPMRISEANRLKHL